MNTLHMMRMGVCIWGIDYQSREGGKVRYCLVEDS